jgi:hypothetical protein
MFSLEIKFIILELPMQVKRSLFHYDATTLLSREVLPLKQLKRRKAKALRLFRALVSCLSFSAGSHLFAFPRAISTLLSMSRLYIVRLLGFSVSEGLEFMYALSALNYRLLKQAGWRINAPRLKSLLRLKPTKRRYSS